MSVMNRRNALIGWTVWHLVRMQAKRRARPQTNNRKTLALAGGAVALTTLAGTFLLLRKRKGDDDGGFVG
jgi:LPXTG-motif cell wall-anchored protein